MPGRRRRSANSVEHNIISSSRLSERSIYRRAAAYAVRGAARRIIEAATAVISHAVIGHATLRAPRTDAQHFPPSFRLPFFNASRHAYLNFYSRYATIANSANFTAKATLVKY